MQWVSRVLAQIIMLFWKGEIDGFGQKPYLWLIIFFVLSSIWFSECCRHCNSWWMCFWIDKYCVDRSLFLCRCFNFRYGGMGLCFICLGFVMGCVDKVGVCNNVVWVGCLLGLTNGWLFGVAPAIKVPLSFTICLLPSLLVCGVGFVSLLFRRVKHCKIRSR